MIILTLQAAKCYCFQKWVLFTQFKSLETGVSFYKDKNKKSRGFKTVISNTNRMSIFSALFASPSLFVAGRWMWFLVRTVRLTSLNSLLPRENYLQKRKKIFFRHVIFLLLCPVTISNEGKHGSPPPNPWKRLEKFLSLCEVTHPGVSTFIHSFIHTRS